jgi:DNA-directed RNA polymerase subunit RPC12/RpoP
MPLPAGWVFESPFPSVKVCARCGKGLGKEDMFGKGSYTCPSCGFEFSYPGEMAVDEVPKTRGKTQFNFRKKHTPSTKQLRDAAYEGVWKCHGYNLEPDAACPRCGRRII